MVPSRHYECAGQRGAAPAMAWSVRKQHAVLVEVEQSAFGNTPGYRLRDLSGVTVAIPSARNIPYCTAVKTGPKLTQCGW
jgi:hypothetical protein